MPSSAWSTDVCSSDRSEEHTSELQSQSNLVCRIIRSEEHTSELQSQSNIVCRLLLEQNNAAATYQSSVSSAFCFVSSGGVGCSAPSSSCRAWAHSASVNSSGLRSSIIAISRARFSTSSREGKPIPFPCKEIFPAPSCE